jgi:hypothetical protein
METSSTAICQCGARPGKRRLGTLETMAEEPFDCSELKAIAYAPEMTLDMYKAFSSRWMVAAA